MAVVVVQTDFEWLNRRGDENGITSICIFPYFHGFRQSTVEDLFEWLDVFVWNGLTDDYYPAQILADLLTIRPIFLFVNPHDFPFFLPPH